MNVYIWVGVGGYLRVRVRVCGGDFLGGRGGVMRAGAKYVSSMKKVVKKGGF